MNTALPEPSAFSRLSQTASEPALSKLSRDAGFGDLHRRFRLPLLAYFRRRVLNPTEAEDLTQDVFERVLRSLGSEPIQNADSYIFTIAVNLLRDRARSVRRRGAEQAVASDINAELASTMAVELSPERVVIAQRTLEEVLAALGELPERTRAMLSMHRFEDLKIREIAKMYAISPSAVEKHVSKALVHITRRLRT